MQNAKRILLVRVPEIEFLTQNVDVRSNAVAGLAVPHGVASLAAVIRRDTDWRVAVTDLYVEFYEELVKQYRPSSERIFDMVRTSLVRDVDNFKPSVVGLSALFLFQHSLVKELARTIKECCPTIEVWLGGYCTVIPDIVMQQIPWIDKAFMGEAETTIVRALKSIADPERFASINALAWREDGAVRINRQLAVVDDLDQLPEPDFDILPLQEYRRILGRTELPMMTSRGCPFSCNFCSSRFYSPRKLRLRTISLLLDEIEKMKEAWNLGLLYIRDDAFNVNKDHAKSFLREYIRRRIQVPWFDTSGFHVNSIDEEFLELCKESGCDEVIFAIESGSERVLRDLMNKQVDLDHARKMADFCHKIGMRLQAYFVIGNPGETKEEILQTIEFARAIQVDHCTFSIATPFPGTRYYDIAIQKGFLVHDPAYVLGMKYMEPNLSTKEFSATWLKDVQYDGNIRVNFLENRSLFGDREALRKAKARFSRIAQQYTFHAVARLIEGWLSGELGDAEGKDRIFLDVKGMMNDREIAGAYGKYFSWDTPTTNEYRRWLEQQKEPEKNVSYEKILTESNRRID